MVTDLRCLTHQDWVLHQKKLLTPVQQCALSEGPLNQILVIVKAERTDLMKVHLRPMINQQYKRFKNLITVVVTHWDLITNEDPEYVSQIKSDIIDMVKLMNVHSIFFCSKQSSGREICKELEKILITSQAHNVILTETEFYANFDLIDLNDDLEDTLNIAKGEVTTKFRKTGNVIKQFISTFSETNPIMQGVMHALTIAIKNIVSQTIEQYEKENNELFSQLYDQCNDINVAYLIDVELKKELMMEMNNLIEIAQKKMKVSNLHCFNFIKRCPHCKTIWMKVSGCNGQTRCGDFPPIDDPIFKEQSQPIKYKFTISDTSVTYQDLGKQNIIEQKQYAEPIQGKVGCGSLLNWSQIPPLEPYLLQELLDPGVLDYLANEVSKEELTQKLQYNLRDEVEKQKRNVKIIELG